MKLTQAMKSKPKWGALIKKRRKQLRLNQTQLGQQFGVSHAAVSDWERNITDPPGAVTWWLTKGGKK